MPVVSLRVWSWECEVCLGSAGPDFWTKEAASAAFLAHLEDHAVQRKQGKVSP
jgi:hypothetical protein